MTYIFKTKKGKLIEVSLKISEYDAYLISHPDLEVYIEAPPRFTFNGRTFGGLDTQIPSGFKDVLQKIGEANPCTELGEKYRKNKTIKDVKTRDVVRDYSKRQAKAVKEAKQRYK